MAGPPTSIPTLEAIQALVKEFEAHYNARDVERLVALFTDDGRLLLPHCGAAQGHAAIRDLVETGMAQFDPLDTVIEPTHIEFSSDIAFSIGNSRHNVRFFYGRRVDEQRKWVSALRREHGEWKLVALIYNTDLPMPRR